MKKLKVNTPFFIFNPKSYLYGEELLKLARTADELAKKYSISIFMTAPYSDISIVSEATENIIVTAQHIDGISPGRGMGYALADSIKNAGANATFLNHAEHPLTMSELVKSMKKADELGILTVVCSDSLEEAKAIATLGPDMILCEPTELIGTGKTSDDSYILETNEAIKSIDSDILVMQAAGISTGDDVYRAISLGADGTGATSGITVSDDPNQTLIDMIEATVRADKELGGTK